MRRPGFTHDAGETVIERREPASTYPPHPTPKPGPKIPNAPSKYQPNEWYARTPKEFSDDPAHSDYRFAVTSKQKVLVTPFELSRQQQANLFGGKPIRGKRRGWISPTDSGPNYTLLTQGFGYFGARRKGGGRNSHHGGLDFVGTDVRMPTDATLIEMYEDVEYGRDANGNPVVVRSKGYTLVFDLGDGMQLSLLHVALSKELLDRWARIKSSSSGADMGMRWIPIGTPLGKVDFSAYGGKNDHVHLQITLQGGTFNGAAVPGFAVDPTPFFQGPSDQPSWWQELLRTFGLD